MRSNSLEQCCRALHVVCNVRKLRVGACLGGHKMSNKHETTRSVLRSFRRDNTIAAAFAELDKPAKEATAIQELSKESIQEMQQTQCVQAWCKVHFETVPPVNACRQLLDELRKSFVPSVADIHKSKQPYLTWIDHRGERQAISLQEWQLGNNLRSTLHTTGA